MTETDRLPVRGTEKRPVANAERIGDVHPEERFEVTLRLRSKANQALGAHVAQLISQPPPTRATLTREAFAERYGADSSDIGKVEAFAQANGLSVVSVSAAQRSVILAGTASQISRAFGVELGAYAHPLGGTYRGRQGPIYVPADLATIVEGVFGVDDRPAAHPHFRRLEDI